MAREAGNVLVGRQRASAFKPSRVAGKMKGNFNQDFGLL